MLVNIVIVPLIYPPPSCFYLCSLYFPSSAAEVLCCRYPVCGVKVSRPNFRQRSTKPIHSPDCSGQHSYCHGDLTGTPAPSHHYLSFTENSHSVLIMYIIMWCIHYTVHDLMIISSGNGWKSILHLCLMSFSRIIASYFGWLL